MYSLDGYGLMIADRVRVQAYAQAMRQSVRPESVVADVGTGPGIFAVLACQLGARRVYAIEPDDIIQLAREVAVANNCADRIVFIEDLSTNVTPPDKFDVVVSDLRGILPLFEYIIPSIVDIRKRLIAPGGILIPRKDTVFAAIAEAPELYRGAGEPWAQNCLDQNLLAGRKWIVNAPLKARLEPKQLLTAPSIWTTIDYRTIENPDVQGEMQFKVERAGTGYGMDVWFESELADNVGFSNAPGAPQSISGQYFFPWTNPVPLVVGQTIHVRLEAKLASGYYAYRWYTQIGSSNGNLLEFDQSTFQGSVISPGSLRKIASDYVPQLSDEGLLDRKILEMMDGRATLEEIARRLAVEYPERFPRWHDAMTAASALSKRYSD
jgi:type I protein arginine methyltransferase